MLYTDMILPKENLVSRFFHGRSWESHMLYHIDFFILLSKCLTKSSHILHCWYSWWLLHVASFNNLDLGCIRRWMSSRWSQVLCRLLNASNHSYKPLELVPEISVPQRCGPQLWDCHWWHAKTHARRIQGPRTIWQHSLPQVTMYHILSLYHAIKALLLPYRPPSPWIAGMYSQRTFHIHLPLVSLPDFLH